MEFLFNKPLNLNSLCMVNGASTRRARLEQTFLLSSINIKRFLDSQNFTGKFVYYNGKLALHPGEDKKHRDILEFIDPKKTDGTGVIAAMIMHRQCQNISGFQHFIILSMGSGFGFPGREEMKKVGEFITGLIKAAVPKANPEMFLRDQGHCFEALIRF